MASPKLGHTRSSSQSAPPNQTPFYHQIVFSRVRKIYFICISKKIAKRHCLLIFWSKVSIRKVEAIIMEVDWYSWEKGLMHRDLLIENVIWRYHNFKYDPFLATEVTWFRKNIWRGDSWDIYFSKIYHLRSQIRGPYLKLWSRHIMFYVIYPEFRMILKSWKINLVIWELNIWKICLVFFRENTSYIFQSRRKNMTLGVVHYTKKIQGPGTRF